MPEVLPELQIRHLLIANRGEIACRIARTARAMGVRTTAIHSDADSRAQHMRACDAAISFGGTAPAESYLDQAKVLAAARSAGADAIHPGYGFLAENPDFAAACADAGIVFVGPSPASMRQLAEKGEARRIAAAAGVPVLEGYDGDDQSDAALAEAAGRIGYPLLIKATAGGGGRGHRVVAVPAALDEALAAARREAKAAFGDDRLLLERLVRPARHIEVQVVGDSHGNVVHLFDRDCSVQRRHQKLVEEAPAPNLPDEVRAAMADAAVTLAKAVDYVGAGTVEFLLGEDGAFHFIEMNARLQVEHTVSEMVTGFDLVAWQLAIAGGAPLPCGQDEIVRAGHAIQVRLNAEDPARDFLPAPGPIDVLRWPATQTGLRIDAGYCAGDTVPRAYDSLVAKMIAHAQDRAAAIALMERALGGTLIGPLPTTAAFARAVLRTPEFVDGAVAVDMIDTGQLAWAPEGLPARAAALAACAWLNDPAPAETPWHRRDGWRPAGRGRAYFTMTVGGTPVDLAVAFADDGYRVTVADEVVAVRVLSSDDATLCVALDGETVAAPIQRDGRHCWVGIDGQTFHVDLFADIEAGVASSATDGTLRAPLPGTVIAVHGAAGDAVAGGDPLVVMEAMKMEHTLRAPFPGVVATLAVAAGDQVALGDVLAVVEAADDA